MVLLPKQIETLIESFINNFTPRLWVRDGWRRKPGQERVHGGVINLLGLGELWNIDAC